MNKYDVGDTVRTSASFTDADDAPADPTTVAVRVRKPDGQLVTGSPTKDSTGAYHYDVVPDQAGNWYYRYIGTGTIVTQQETGFYVREQRA